MNRYIENLKSFLAEQTPNFGYDDAKSILDMLYYYYTDTNPVDGSVIRCQFKELDKVLSKLSWAECERVFTLAVGYVFPTHNRHSRMVCRLVCACLRNYKMSRRISLRKNKREGVSPLFYPTVAKYSST